MKALKTVLVLSILVGITLPVSVSAQSNPLARQHEGLFLRFLLGAGPGSINIDDDFMEFSSIGADFHFQIGGSVAENFILFGDIGGFSLTNPDVEIQGTAGTTEDVSVSAMGYGMGATYYIMPSNIFLSGSVMYVSDTIEYENEDAGESDSGLGFFISAGKEWWVGDNWGLGAAVFFEYGSLKDKEDAAGNQADITNHIFGVMFTATMD
ncbi:MAG: hypothetical protein R6V04_17260 [bacterium]